MTKQVKIGFDKTPAPLVETNPELVDIQGLPLTDSAGNRLITSVIEPLDTFNRKKSALSVVAGNAGLNEAIPIQERFAAFSEVSTNLLGVERAEEQLSLFSDVSSYGLDPDNWNYYSVGKNKFPQEWYNRKHPIFGERKFADFYEETTEQALYLKSFPTQYTFPFGPSYTGGEKSRNFTRYLSFIAFGRWMWEVWQLTNEEGRLFADRNFIPNVLTIVTDDGAPVPILPNSWTKTGIVGNAFLNEVSFYDIEYRSGTNSSVQVAMDYIEQWTLFFDKIRAGTASYPLYVVPPTPTTVERTFIFTGNAAQVSPPLSGIYRNIQNYASNTEATRPGDKEENESVAILESRKTFRYQPGRISGFTFGLRLKNNTGSTSDKIEWGAANPTDQYMFQVAGTQWNIVRRSTVLPPLSLIEGRWELEPYSQYVSVDEQLQPAAFVPPGKDNSVPMYEVVIPRSKWNGDKLDGSGESGYIIDFSRVTMYKIEYSWYGAIGAKFYAYIPVGSGEARWVRLHTIIIENQMDKPVLQNPDFKFRYMVYNKNTSNLTEPTYVYKYGASYYIDGGDEGTTSLTSITALPKEFNTNTSILAIHPKNKIINKTGLTDDGTPYEGNINLKKGYPKTLSVFSTKDARIDITNIKVSPDGAHGAKSVSLVSTNKFERDIKFNLTDNFTTVSIAQNSPNLNFNHLDYNAKIIGDGIYNLYVNYNPLDDTQSTILRRENYELVEKPYKGKVKYLDGQVQDVSENTTFEGRVVNYRSLTGSDVPITAPKFKVHFLNPAIDGFTNKDNNGFAFSDFLIGFTEKKPEFVVTGEGNFLSFGALGRVYTDSLPGTGNTYFDISKEVYVEFTNRENIYDVQRNAEYYETDMSGAFRLEQDERIRGDELPSGQFSGAYSCVAGSSEKKSFAVSAVLENPDGTFRMIFSGEAPPASEKDLQVGQIGINNVASEWIIVSSLYETLYEGEIKKAINVEDSSGGVPTFPAASIGTGKQYPNIQVRLLSLHDDYKLTDDPEYSLKFGPFYRILAFNDLPLYPFIAMRSNAQINNIIIEEIGAQGSQTHIPQFVGTTAEDPLANITILAETGVSALGLPSEFNPQDRLSGIQYDTQTLNPIREGKVIYSFFVGANKAEQFQLDNIFNVDRNFISPGLYNNNATYVKATSLDGQTGEIRVTITTREQ